MNGYSKVLFDHEEPRMALPGYLNDVAPQHAVLWNGIVTGLLDKAVRGAHENYAGQGYDLPVQIVADGDHDLNEGLIQQTWPAYPQRYATALGTRNTDRFLCHRSDVGVQGRLGQEEYLEWRDVRDEDGRLLRVEMTTETRDYWAFLASVDPEQTLQLLADFARVGTIDPRDVYGAHDPFGSDSTPALRKCAFLTEMARSAYNQPVRGNFNNGSQAIAFMSNSANSLAATINLFAYGAYPFGTVDGSRALTGPELIATMPFGAAADCRNSDPNIFGTAISHAWDGRKLALANPAGIYIKDAGRTGDLLLPDKITPVPKSWIKFSRGTQVVQNDVDFSFFQRLVIEPDPASGLVLGDLIVAQTGQPVTSGVDIARLVTVALYMKTSNANVSSDFEKVALAPARTANRDNPKGRAYRDVHAVYGAWLEDQSAQSLNLTSRAMRCG